jgi:hypothetical protein
MADATPLYETVVRAATALVAVWAFWMGRSTHVPAVVGT